MEVSKNDRIVNYTIDLITIIILTLILSPFEYLFGLSFLTILVFFLYYFLFELIMNRTLGKLVTKTIVRSTKNVRPNVLHIFARTLLRFASPFDALSYLTGREQGIHDILSKTRLVKRINLQSED